MPPHLRPMTPSDTLTWTRMRAEAYAGPTHDVLHVRPVSEASIRGVAQERRKELVQPNTWHWKIVDTALQPGPDDPGDNGGRTIALAVWKMVNVPVEEEEGEEREGSGEKEAPFVPPELRLDALGALFGPLVAAQKEVMRGVQKYLVLDNLLTQPEHRGRGAARMLLDWGLRKADEERVPCYLDTTAMAQGIYEVRGFRLVKEVLFNRTEWGGEGEEWHGCMVRDAQGDGREHCSMERLKETGT